jgi:hypothetical protein
VINNEKLALLDRFGFLFVLIFNSSIGISQAQPKDVDAFLDTVSIQLREGDDFATRNLRNAWDMSEFADISQALNQSGQVNYLTNILVQDGVFSARSTSLRDAHLCLILKLQHSYAN